MRLIQKPYREYIGWYVQCSCGAISEITSSDDLKTAQTGDMKDEGTMKWGCPHCHALNIASYSRLKHDSGVLKGHIKAKHDAEERAMRVRSADALAGHILG